MTPIEVVRNLENICSNFNNYSESEIRMLISNELNSQSLDLPNMYAGILLWIEMNRKCYDDNIISINFENNTAEISFIKGAEKSVLTCNDWDYIKTNRNLINLSVGLNDKFAIADYMQIANKWKKVSRDYYIGGSNRLRLLFFNTLAFHSMVDAIYNIMKAKKKLVGKNSISNDIPGFAVMEG